MHLARGDRMRPVSDLGSSVPDVTGRVRYRYRTRPVFWPGAFRVAELIGRVGGTTPDTHDRPHGLRPQGWPSPQDEALRGTALLGASRKAPGRYYEIC